MINKRGKEGWNAIHFTVFYGNTKILNYFIDR
jgi:hypothetical protein